MITIQNLSFRYAKRRRWIIKDLNLTVNAGDRLWLTGPSGCGKSTLLRLLMGLEKPQNGTVTGMEPGAISVVFQEDRLIPGLTALQNVALFSDEATAAELLDRLGLSEAADLMPSELSGGMKRRVAIARALAGPFTLLLLDEPMNGLDETTAGQTAQVISSVLGDRTLILVTHNAAEAAALQAIPVELPLIK